MIERWATLRSSAVVRLLGVTLGRNVSMVTEFYSLGPLDIYLQKHKNDLEEVDLVEAATYIASALWHMVILYYIFIIIIIYSIYYFNNLSLKILNLSHKF